MSRAESKAGQTPQSVSKQLELFPVANEAPQRRGVSPKAARLSVSPGWWPRIQPIFGEGQEIEVHECREVDGTLVLRASPVDQTDNGDWLEPLLQRARDLCATTCGCCGGPEALPSWDSTSGLIRTVCSNCCERLKAGTRYLDIVERYWRFDGTRRALPPLSKAPISNPVERTGPKRECTSLSPEELRKTIADIASAMRAEIVGHDDAVRRLSLLAGLHVGGGLARGGRVLMVGPSGVGKSALVQALRHAVEALNFDVPFVATNAGDLTSPGWSGAPTIGDLLEEAIGNSTPDSSRARHAIVFIDEIHHAGLVDGIHGNMLAKRQEVLASLLSLVGHGTLHLGEGAREWSSERALVIALGAFTGLLDTRRVPTPSELVSAGLLNLEFATRFEEVITLKPLAERELIELLRRWPPLVSLVEVCKRLGYPVRIHEETYARAARAVALGRDGSTARTAGSWLVAALREILIVALADDAVRELVITPDSLTIARVASRHRPPDDPPDSEGGWDATMIVRPR